MRNSTRAACGLAISLTIFVGNASAAGAYNIFKHVSVAQAGTTDTKSSAGASFEGASVDGTHVFFRTSDQMVTADVDGGASDVYQRAGDTTTLVSGGSAYSGARFLAASADGSRVVFGTSEALLPADTDSHYDIYERAGKTLSLVSGRAGGQSGSYDARFFQTSSDGSHIVFETREALTADDHDDAFDVYERFAGKTRRLSVAEQNDSEDARVRGMSTDAARIFFSSYARLVSGDTDDWPDVYERSNEATNRVSVGQVGGNGSWPASFAGTTPDGSHVFFSTQESLVRGDTDRMHDVYDRFAGTTKRTSKGTVNGSGDYSAWYLGASADGTHAFFRTQEQLTAADADARWDVYERSNDATTLVSAGGNGAYDATFAAASADGAHVFIVTAERLAAADTDWVADVYERWNGATRLVSTGAVNGNGSFPVDFARASLDGARVLFESQERLSSDDTDSQWDVYTWSNGTVSRVSRGQVGGNGAHAALYVGATPDLGRAFFTTSERLACSDVDNGHDVYSASSGLPQRPTNCGTQPAAGGQK